MQIKEIETSELEKETIKMFNKKCKFKLNILGDTKDYVYLQNKTSIAIYDKKNKKLVLPFTKGTNIKRVLINGEKCFIILKEVNYWKIESIDIYNNNFIRLFHYESNYINTYNSKDGNKYIEIHDKNNTTICYTELEKIEYSTTLDKIKRNIDSYFTDNNYYSSEKKESDKWDSMSKFKNGLAIIYKDGNYGIINRNYEIIFDYDPNITYINPLSSNIIILEDKDGNKYLYNIKEKLKITFNEDINLENFDILSNTIYRLKLNCKYALYIKNKRITDELYDDILGQGKTLILKQDKKYIFTNLEGEILLTLETDNFYLTANAIYFEEDGTTCAFDLNTKEIIKLEESIYQTEDGEIIPYEKVNSQKYPYYFYNKQFEKIILFKNKKYGIELSDGEYQVIRWRDKKEDIIYLHQSILEQLLPNKKEKTRKRC